MSGALDNWNPSLFQLILFAVGGGLVYLGQEWAVPGTTDIGIACLGLLVAVVAVDIGWRRIGFFRTNGWANVIDSYRGVLELIWAALLLCAGILIMSVPVLGRLLPGGIGGLITTVLAGSTGIGLVLTVTGLIFSLNGIIRALAGSGTVSPKRLGTFGNALDRLAGVVVLAVGLAVASAGLLLLSAPAWVSSVVQQISGQLSTP